MNVELLNRVWKQIDSQPETWNQAMWIKQDSECGTTACVAGWAALLSGWEPLASDCAIKDGEEPKTVSRAAVEELGLTCSDADYLFYADRTYDEIKEFVTQANKEEEEA